MFCKEMANPIISNLEQHAKRDKKMEHNGIKHFNQSQFHNSLNA